MSHRHHHGAAGGDAGALSPGERVRLAIVATVLALATLTLIGIGALWPDDRRPASSDNPLQATEPAAATVVAVETAPCSGDPATTCDVVRLELDREPSAAASFELARAGSPITLEAGDEILVDVVDLGGGEVVYNFYDFQRGTPMTVLAVGFLVAVLILGGWRGVGAIAGLAASLLVIVTFLLPSLLDGNDPVLVALVAASAVAFIALYLSHGFTIGTSVALVGTFASLAVTGVLAWIFVTVTHLTGFTDDSAFFLSAAGADVDRGGIVLAGFVIGSLGVLDDMTVTQVAAVAELRAARPDASIRRLYASAVRIGRDHVSSAVNTLFLAYAGAALPLLLLFTESARSVTGIVTSEIVATEIVRALVGSIGLVASVPITTGLAVLALAPAAPPLTAAPQPAAPPPVGR